MPVQSDAATQEASLRSLRVLILYNRPSLDPVHPDSASEAGVLESVAAFREAIERGGHAVRAIGVGSSLAALLAEIDSAPRPNVVVNLCEGFAGQPAGEAHVVVVLELLGLAYTGSRPDCLALVRDKARTKWLLRGSGLPTADSLLVEADGGLDLEWAVRGFERGPLIVKPACEDASLGISQDSVVQDLAALRVQVERVRERYGRVLVEEYIDGREFNVSVLAAGGDEVEVLPLAEIEFREANAPWKLVTYDAKWARGSSDDAATPVRCPATADPDLTVDLTVAALAAFRVCGMRDYGRVDLRVDERGRVFILEVNANPDLAPGAGFARALAASGRSYDGFACALVEAAFLRGADMRPQAIGGAAQHLTEGRRLVPQAAEPSLEGTIALGNLDPADVGDLVEVLVACGNFRPDEVAVGREVLEEAARQAPDGHYQVVVARSGGKAVGWAAYGLVPLTDATYDLYWIAVHPRVQDRGAGRVLLEEVERRVRAAGGRWLLAETSGSAGYAKTHGFYLRRGYAEVAVIPDFYRLGDARSTFGRRLD